MTPLEIARRAQGSSLVDEDGHRETLDGSFQFIDLRKAKTGDGFSWGRYGPRTVVRRHGETLLFAVRRDLRRSRC